MFIYARNEAVQEALVKAGFKLITKKEHEGKSTVWIFDYDDKIPIPNFEDKDMMFISKRMSF